LETGVKNLSSKTTRDQRTLPAAQSLVVFKTSPHVIDELGPVRQSQRMGGVLRK
jgi:hypothetical protein